MDFKNVHVQFYERAGDVGTVIGYPLAVTEEVRKDKSEFNSALTVTETFDMPFFDLRHEQIYDLFERLDPFCICDVVVLK